MNTSDFLWFVLQEHIGNASIIPFVTSVTLEAMRLFGDYDLTLPLVASVIGSVIGCALNWGIGMGIRFVGERTRWNEKNEFKKSSHFFTHYGVALAAFYWIPLGAIILVILGFFRAPLWKILIAVTVGSFIHFF
jgi:membrane protein YqaA with SNARE-associated domain